MRLCLIGPGAAMALAGCASIVTAEGERLALASGEFRGYVGQVFREQNQRTVELLEAQERAGAEGREELVRVEESLLAACAGLNELAVALRDSRRMGALQRRELARSAPGCEEAAAEARSLLTDAGADPGHAGTGHPAPAGGYR